MSEKEEGKVENNYLDSISQLSPPARELLENYAHIPEDEILTHVHQLVGL
jgi:hypothetical protein